MSKSFHSLVGKGLCSTIVFTQAFIPDILFTEFVKPVEEENISLHAEGEVYNSDLITNAQRRRRRSRGVAVSRGDCQIAGENLPELLTLVPDELISEPLLTTSERPTFWVYSPYIVDENTRVEFQLYNRSNRSSFRPIFSQNIEASRPGIFGITLPATAPALELGHEYQWFISIYCDGNDTTLIRDSAFIKLSNETTSTAWYDQITNLTNALRQDSSNSVRRDWENLLNSADLGDLIGQPIVD